MSTDSGSVSKLDFRELLCNLVIFFRTAFPGNRYRRLSSSACISCSSAVVFP